MTKVATKRRRDFRLCDLPTRPATNATPEATIAPPIQLPAASSAATRPGRRHSGTATFVAVTRHPTPATTTAIAIRFQSQSARNTSRSAGAPAAGEAARIRGEALTTSTTIPASASAARIGLCMWRHHMPLNRRPLRLAVVRIPPPGSGELTADTGRRLSCRRRAAVLPSTADGFRGPS